jgi:hypothetical protein
MHTKPLCTQIFTRTSAILTMGRCRKICCRVRTRELGRAVQLMKQITTAAENV